MVCMYCGAPATATREWQEENRRPTRNSGGGTDIVPTPGGDDPVSAVFGLLMLPFALWELLKGLVAAVGAVAGWVNRPGAPAGATSPPPPPKPPLTTRVVVTTCERHARFRSRFVWAGLGALAVLVTLWGWAITILRRDWGTDHTDLAANLTLLALGATFVLPLALAFWYVLAGPVIVDRATESTVVLDRVRQAYFDATGLKPSGPPTD